MSAYLQQKSGTPVVKPTEPPFNRQNFEQVVSKSDSKDWHRSCVQHRVELNEIADHWDSTEIEVEPIWVWLAREWWLVVNIFAVVRESTESIPSELRLDEKQECTDDIRNEEHPWDLRLRTNRMHDTWHRVMIDENEDCVSKHCGQVRQLIAQVNSRCFVHSISSQVVNSACSHHEHNNQAHYRSDYLQCLAVFNVAEAEADT